MSTHVQPPPSDAAQPPDARPVGTLGRWLFLALGLICLGLAYLGWLLPGLPCTPFVLLASLCFGKSSPRLQRWLLNNRLFGLYLRDFQERRGMRFRMKIRATIFIVLVVSLSVGTLVYAGKPWDAWAFIPAVALVGMSIMWFWVTTLPDRE
jgi:uncharacterized membrane protein YbaN (DUF454 family)